MGNNLTTAENDALVMWTCSDRSRDAFMAAVRHAIGLTEERLDQTDDHRIAFLREELAAVRDIAYRASGPGSFDAVEEIFRRASRALTADADR